MPGDEIDKFYKRNTFHHILYGFINGIQSAIPSITRKESAEMFKVRFKLYKDCSVEHLLVTYERINKDLIDAEKQKK